LRYRVGSAADHQVRIEARYLGFDLSRFGGRHLDVGAALSNGVRDRALINVVAVLRPPKFSS